MPGLLGGLLSPDVLNKKTAPYFIWTCIFLVCALYFWLTRSPQKPDEGAAGAERQSSSSTTNSGARRPGAQQRVNRRASACVALDGTVLRPECHGCEVIDEALAPFLELCTTSELFTIAVAADDIREAQVKKMLENIGAFDAGLRPHRVMFSSTVEGRVAMVRQLQPAVHYEAATSVYESLQGKVSKIRLVGSADCPTLTDAVRQPEVLSAATAT